MFKLKKKTGQNDEEIVISQKPNSEDNIDDTSIIKTEDSVNENVESVETDNKKEKKSLFKKKTKENKAQSNGENGQKVVKWGPNRILQCFAYFAIILIAIAMILRLIFKTANPSIMVYMQGIGEVLAYIVCIWLSFYFTMKRGSVWWLVGWVVATVILVIFYIFSVVNL